MASAIMAHAMASAIMAHAPVPALNLIGTTNMWQGQQLNHQTEAAGRGLNGSFVIFEVSGLEPGSVLCAVRVSLLAVTRNNEEIFITRADIPADVLREQQQGALVHCPSPADIDNRTHVQVNFIAFTRNAYGNALFIVNEGSMMKKDKTNGATGKFLRVRLEVVCNDGQHLLNQVNIRWQSNLSNGRKQAHRENLAHFRVAYNLHAARTIRHVLEHGTMDPSSPSDRMGNLDYLLDHAHTAKEYVEQQQPETHLNGDVFLLDTVRSFLPSRAPTSRAQLDFATTEGECYLKQDTRVLSATPGSIDDANEAFKGTLARGHVSAISSDAPLAVPSSNLGAWVAPAGQEYACAEDDLNSYLDDPFNPETLLSQFEVPPIEVSQSVVSQSEVSQSEVSATEDNTYQDQEDSSPFMPHTSHFGDHAVDFDDLQSLPLEEGSFQDFQSNTPSDTHEMQDALVDDNLGGMENLDDENVDSSSLKRARDDDAELENANHHKRIRN
ncbi:Hypothetical Protein FCC1311_080212 [Hondaea fermentalgiana]|uniref:Uncharacterized protein n=1 Tax=Hondaea fermentalgiana TaxID=2315210 RepID=A0A2R5GLM2_9STRA|nr:Hypothetical Protein FCC1311_080212 [Hondaea fermentalgiana]|eukprot:GBG31796.1 Hypothetical Protein FCC1311_080212 [Hondaea fermentalgiana]